MKSKIDRDRLAGMVGNFLEHYDNALFGLLAPLIAPLFFEERDPLTALILTYSMLPLGLITRPLGALFFGWIGDSFSRKQALFLSLSGMALATVLMGCLPIYKDIGPWASFFLALGRLFQGFFSAGEAAGGAIFILEYTPLAKRSLMSSFYDAGSIAGALFASSLVTLMSAQGWIETGWRYLFWTAAITALFGIILRRKSSETSQLSKPQKKEFFLNFRKLIRPFLRIFFAAGFSYTTYSLPFTLMNGFVPLVTSLTKTQTMQVNTSLLVYDMLLLPIMGCLACRFGKERIMVVGAGTAVLFAIPLFYLLDQASLGTVIAVRLAIISSGVAFSASYYAWAIEQVPSQHRYLILSLAGACGSQLIGMPASAICLWLFQTFGWSWTPGLYLETTGTLAACAVLLSIKKEKSLALQSK